VELPDARGLKPSRFYRSRVAVISLPDGVEFGVMLVLRDVTDDRQLGSLKEKFFQQAARDLRAPLFAVQGRLRLVEQSMQPTPHQREYLESISRSCESLLARIDDALDSARLETGHGRLAAASVDPVSLMRRVADRYAAFAAERSIRLETQLPLDPPGTIMAEERLLERVLDHLLSNALKFTPRDGLVKMSLVRSGENQVEFSISDTGPGLTQDKKARLFDVDGPAANDRPSDGSVRGLAACQKIVQLHKGSLWVHSEAGMGSQFIFRIPINQAEAG
jgi:two-component system capsular synthesis sensor histidine kinase RcsC